MPTQCGACVDYRDGSLKEATLYNRDGSLKEARMTPKRSTTPLPMGGGVAGKGRVASVRGPSKKAAAVVRDEIL